VTTYRAFGLVVASGVPLPGVPEAPGGTPDVVLEPPEHPVSRHRPGPARRVRLPDGRTAFTVARCGGGELIRFARLAEFLVSGDGREIRCAVSPNGSARMLAHLFLAQVIPLALSRQGRLVLHASAVATPGGAVAFMGAAGSGKSTLGASFVRAAFPLLADDGLLLTEDRDTLAAVPSYPEIRLWPDACAALSAVGEPSETWHLAGKTCLPAGGVRWPFASAPVPVRRLYVLGGPAVAAGEGTVTVEPLGGRERFLQLVSHSFRLDVEDSRRLRSEFETIGRIASTRAVYRLTFPRQWSCLASVRDAVLAHLAAA
jgi:hypothetical protein